MQLIARIDANGRCFIGKKGRDNKWVKSNNTRPVAIVRNENGGESLAVEDIAYAKSSSGKPCSGTFYAEPDVKDFCENGKGL